MRRLFLCILATALLPGCFKVGIRQQDRPDAATQVDRFLDNRAKKLDARDVEGFLAGLSPEARAFETPLANGTLTAPITGIELSLANASRFDETNTIGVRVSFSYRYQSLPGDNVFRVPLLYDLLRVAGGWMVAASKAEDPALLPAWMTGPIQSATSEHFLALFRPGSVDAARALGLAEEARGKLAAKLTTLEPKHLMLLAKDRAEYEQLAARQSPVSAVAQAETSYEVTPGSIKVQSRQMVVNMQKLLEDRTEVETFQHELGHLALAQDTRPFTPAWVSESAAMYLADTRPTGLWRAGSRRGRFDEISFETLSSATSLGEHDPTGEVASYEYAYSAAAAYSLIETYGADRYWTFYKSYAAVPASRFYEGLPSDRIASERDAFVTKMAVETTDEALKSVFGIDEAALDARVRAWIKRQR